MNKRKIVKASQSNKRGKQKPLINTKGYFQTILYKNAYYKQLGR